MPLLFGATSLLASFLLFCVEPMVAKMMLPALGGGPSVWNTCLVFFQGALTLGYLFASWSLRRLGTQRQPLVQLALVAAAWWLLPISLPLENTDALLTSPALQALTLLALHVGLPFFVLASVSPTLQRWYSRTDAPGAEDPYFLYAASNVGSLLALLAYPLIVEPRIGLGAQSAAIRAGYALFGALLLACAVFAVRRAVPETSTPSLAPTPLSRARRLRWAFWAAVPSAYLVAITTYLTTEVMPTPLLWIAPLALYLSSFILVFARRRWLPHRWIVRGLPMGLLLAVLANGAFSGLPTELDLGIHSVSFFFTCMLCHGELANDRPSSEHLNSFYAWMSLGGLVAGLLVALAAPVLFDRMLEYPLCLLLAAAAMPAQERTMPKARTLALVCFAVAALTVAIGWLARRTAWNPAITLALTGVVLIGVYREATRPRVFVALLTATTLGALVSFPVPGFGAALAYERNFFGAFAVFRSQDERFNVLVHGTTIHGRQTLAARAEPIAYYARSGPTGDLFELHRRAEGRSAKVAVVGLGVGSVAAYARPNELWSFFELDLDVVRVAQNPAYFTFLRDAFGDLPPRIVVGDARITLARDPLQYDLLMIDAFSSDAVPVHLLTDEAVQLFRQRLTPNGLLAWHISNRYLDLEPLLSVHAERNGLEARIRRATSLTAEERLAGVDPSVWVVMAHEPGRLANLGDRWRPLTHSPGFRVWTDDLSSIVSVWR